MKWLCKWRHKWFEEMNILTEVPFPTVIPNSRTFYDNTYQPRYVRTCKRCGKFEVSKQDCFGNKWFVDPVGVQYES